MIRKKKLFSIIFILLGLLSLTFLISLSLGDSKVGITQVLDIIIGKSDRATQLIILKIRLPRLVVCLVSGAALALSGSLLQTLTRNPLADSGILGINSGAGIVIALVIGYFSLEDLNILKFLPFYAMLGGFCTILLVYFISQRKGQGISPVRLIITGVGVSTMLSGMMVTIVGKINRYKIDYIVHWLSGQISGDDWGSISLLSPFLIVLCILTYWRVHNFNIMNLNDHTAKSLGLRLNRERGWILFLSTSLAALSVVLAGNITFIGLLSGNISKRFVGNNHKYHLPVAMLIGMLILTISDSIGRVLLVGTGIPTGLIVSIVGAPYFLYLLTRVR